MQIQPLNNNVLLEIVQEDEKFGAFIVPGSENQKSEKGKVLAIGNSVSADLEVGQTVIIGKYAGIEIAGFLLVADTDIAGIARSDEEVAAIKESQRIKDPCEECGGEKNDPFVINDRKLPLDHDEYRCKCGRKILKPLEE